MTSDHGHRFNGPPLKHHVRNICFASFYLFVLSTICAAATGRGFLITFAVFAAAALLLSILTLLFFAQSAVGEKGLRQFGLSAIFILTLAFAVYLALLRWLIAAPQIGSSDSQSAAWIIAAIMSIPGLILSAPFVIFLCEMLIWAAVAIVRMPSVRRWLFRRRAPAETTTD